MQIKPPGDPHLLATVNGPPLTADVRTAVTSALERLLGLRIDLAAFHRLAARLDLEALAEKPDADALAQLRQLHGVGRWTAEYVLLRGLGRLHIFPGDDVGARNNLQRWLRLTDSLDYEGVARTLAPWRH